MGYVAQKLCTLLRGVDGHERGRELAAIVPRSYCTRGIWARQEEKAGSGGVSNWLKGMRVADAGENWALWHPFSEDVHPDRRRRESIRATFGEMQFPDFGSRYNPFLLQIYGEASLCLRDFVLALLACWEQFSRRPRSSAKFPGNHHRLRRLLPSLSMPLI